jgi:hypothetical protein
MISQTRRSLEDFDNQHDFERMAADVLNSLGYTNVEPMAPGGGSDGGQDIKFSEGDTVGIVFVTLDKKIGEKFKRDLAKQNIAEGLIALFCNVDVSPAMKLEFAKEAISKGYRLEVFDLERLRSLLDSSLKEIRRRYLKIDDEIAAKLRSEVTKLLRFPDATSEATVPPTLVETILADRLPSRLFDLLMLYEEKDIKEIPGIGASLHNHLTTYYQFRQDAIRVEDNLLLSIGQTVGVRFPAAWRIYLKYVMMRFGGASKETIISWGEFLNYGITWDDAERVYVQLSADAAVSSKILGLFDLHNSLCQSLNTIIASIN